ncbi:hypothetical protein GCM10010387_37970 [Streptomyces inusitatus]|uniref:Uncharacterized protein n=1 Tax=Streptomyces inusitatus TaxID=68221 RepID=A0A918QB76_9ACTN|nr:hypothetical protein [Streptomyces inusitatus]GGZ40008.1 hypothetical protein GCM10010387_37970 [Streptomyces inusitatus]
MSLTAVYVADTGHVVGALTLTGAAAPTDVAELVGPALPVRVSLGAGRTVSLSLPDRRLAAVAADDEPGVLADPLAFGVDAPDGRPRPTLLRLAAWSEGLALAADGLTVTLPLAVNRVTPVLALISDGEDTHVLTGEIPDRQSAVTLPVTLEAGSRHGLLVLVAGWAGRLTGAEAQ